MKTFTARFRGNVADEAGRDHDAQHQRPVRGMCVHCRRQAARIFMHRFDLPTSCRCRDPPCLDARSTTFLPSSKRQPGKVTADLNPAAGNKYLERKRHPKRRICFWLSKDRLPGLASFAVDAYRCDDSLIGVASCIYPYGFARRGRGTGNSVKRVGAIDVLGRSRLNVNEWNHDALGA